MLEIVRVDDSSELDGLVVRYQFRVKDETRAPTFPKGEIRASRHGVVLAGPFFPMNPAAARLVQAALERAWLQADYMAWAFERTGRDIALTEAEINMVREQLKRIEQASAKNGSAQQQPSKPDDGSEQKGDQQDQPHQAQ
ncbi:MAG: hypothetical protein GYB65_21235 [Chloroflexi bacterium]|nr:hypothetical protein [Chloroflexota bacterium]